MFSELILVSILLLLIYNSIHLERPHNFPPGPKNYPIIGANWFLDKLACKTGAETFEKLGEIFGPVTGLFSGNIRVVVVNGFEAAKEMFSREDFAFRPELFLRTYPFNGELRGVFSTNGHVWKEQRRFTVRNLRDLGFGKRSMEGVIHEEIEATLNLIKKEIKAQDGIVPMNNKFVISVTNVLWSIVTGRRFAHDDRRFQKLLAKLNLFLRAGDVKINLANMYPWTRFIPFLAKDVNQMMDGFSSCSGIIEDAIDDHKSSFGMEDNNSSLDFIDKYLTKIEQEKLGDNTSSFNEKQLAAVCFDLFSAGSESTASTIDFAILYMLLYQDVQQKVHQEIESVIGKDRFPTMTDIPNLPYCEAVLTELLRITPIAPVAVHHTNIVDTKFRGYDLPKGTVCSINIRSVHMEKSHWGDPENFRPERFLDGNGKFVKPERVLAFGYGKRACIGESLARMTYYLFFITFMQQFRIEQVKGLQKPTTQVLDGFTVAPEPFSAKLTLKN